ncbi:MAG: hypothetical protein ACFFDI_05765 [Promethearchaeota archaeon]
MLRPIINRITAIKLPWPDSLLRKPRMNLEMPSLDLAYRSPGRYILGILLLATLFIMAGGLYDITEIPIAFGSNSYGQPLLISPSQNSQFLIESIVAAIFFALGTAGIYLIKSTVDNEDSRTTTITLSLGIVLILIGIAGGILMLQQKLGG